MKINIKSVLTKEAERKAEIKPLPKIIIKGAPKLVSPILLPPGTKLGYEYIDSENTTSASDTLLKELFEELGALKRQRGKLSSHTAHLVKEIEARLSKESPATAAEFMKGNIPMSELVIHYNKIQALTEQATGVWDNIRHVKDHGKLPEVVSKVSVDNGQSMDAKAINYELTRLKDLIHKTKKKLEQAQGGIKAPKNSDRVIEWREKIALAEAQRIELRLKLKDLKV